MTVDDSAVVHTPRPEDLFAPRRRRLFRGRRAVGASALSTLLVLAGALWVVWYAPGGQAVREFFFSPQHAWDSFVGNPARGLISIGHAFLTNIWMFLLCEVLVLIFGLLIAVVRLTKSPVLTPWRWLAVIYTDLFRGIPILLVLFMVGFGLPALQVGFLSRQSPAVYACITLTITYSAYVAEVYRAGVQAVPQGQIMAARSLGLTEAVVLRRVVLPQAVRTIIPPLLNDFISLQKDTALVSTLGVVEATDAGHIYASQVFNYTGFTVAALLFLLLTIPLTRYTDHLIARDRQRRLAGGV
jgi:polar amino acid transport system permease protein